jgi:EmrB/QacA subfamily drug resistance transporter
MSSHPSCDAAIAQSGKGGRADHPALILTTTILASSLAFVDGSVVNVGLPAIGHSLGGDAQDLQWIVNAYLLPLSAFLLLGGAAGDRFGRGKMLVIGVALFGASSAICAVAPSIALLLAARALQGFGAALLLPNSLAILGNAFSGEARGRAVGTWSAASSIGAAIGPVLGGWLIDNFGWRTIFLINVPLALGAVGLALAVVRDPPRARDAAPIDAAGALLASAALALLTWGLTLGSGPVGWSMTAIAATGGGVVLLLSFLWLEKRRGEAAMMPLSLFSSPDFIGLSILTLLLYGALGAMFVLIPFVLIQGAHLSGTAAGAALLPIPIILAGLARTMGAFAGRVGSRLPLSVGPAIVALGFCAFLLFEGDYWRGMLPALIMISLGMAGAVAPLTTAVLASVDAGHTGAASGLNSAIARLGGLLATALIGGVLAARGEALISAFHVASIACAAAALLAGGAAFALVGRHAR